MIRPKDDIKKFVYSQVKLIRKDTILNKNLRKILINTGKVSDKNLIFLFFKQLSELIKMFGLS